MCVWKIMHSSCGAHQHVDCLRAAPEAMVRCFSTIRFVVACLAGAVHTLVSSLHVRIAKWFSQPTAAIN